MNPTIITARITDQHLQLVNVPLIASGGEGIIQIRFEFCGLWEGCGKTAVFYRDPKQVYHVPIADGLATVPWEVLTEAGYFYLGVFGVKSNRRPTEVVKIKVAKGAIVDATAEPQEPTPNIYEQLVAAYGVAEARVDNLIAPKDPISVNELDTFTFYESKVNEQDDGRLTATFTSNGVFCFVELDFEAVSVEPESQFTTIWERVPLKFMPMRQVAIPNPFGDKVYLYLDPGEVNLDQGVGYVRVLVRNSEDGYYSLSTTYSAEYPVLYPTLPQPEVRDLRITTYRGTHDTAGGALRALDEALMAHENLANENYTQFNEHLHSVDEEVADLNDAISVPVPGNNLLNPDDLTPGYVSVVDGSVGSSPAYSHTKPISVTEGDVIRSYNTSNAGLAAKPYNMGFIAAYGGGKIIPQDKAIAQNITEYVVPVGVDSIVVSVTTAVHMITKNYEPSVYEKWEEPTRKANPEFFSDTVGAIVDDRLASITHGDVSPYIKPHSDAVAARLKALQNEYPKSLTIGFLTDMHFDYTKSTIETVLKNNIGGIGRIAQSCKVEGVFFGGDNLQESATHDAQIANAEAFAAIITNSSVPCMLAKGNHDDSSIKGWDASVGKYKDGYHITDKEYYARCFKHNENRWNIGMDKNRDKLYYYVDFPSQQIRVIVLNCVDIPYINDDGYLRYHGQHDYGYSEAQLKWVIEQALDFSDKKDAADWDVITIQHIGDNSALKGSMWVSDIVKPEKNADVMVGIFDAFRKRTTYSFERTSGDFACNISCDFTNAEQGIICRISGHTHKDYDETYDGLLYLSTMQAGSNGVGNEASKDGNTYTKTANSAMESAFDFFTIDKDSKKIFATRFGAGVDREIDY